ncbi:hypothetical protein AC249_AIPGENE4809 [Exaiptasia diaphana]|nr:hypothetical protein AC249_AIPGENE4809 [Exaiptasia diaphana]
MTDDMFGDSFKICLREAQQVKSLGFRLVCVGLGVHLDIKQLESMATDGTAVLYHGDIKQGDVCQKLLQGIHGQDTYGFL